MSARCLRDARGDGCRTPTSETSFTLMRALRISTLEIEDELLEILDRIDVVVRRRRDQRHPRRRETGLRAMTYIHLVAGQLPPLAGFRPLRDLDLELIATDKVRAC